MRVIERLSFSKIFLITEQGPRRYLIAFLLAFLLHLLVAVMAYGPWGYHSRSLLITASQGADSSSGGGITMFVLKPSPMKNTTQPSASDSHSHQKHPLTEEIQSPSPALTPQSNKQDSLQAEKKTKPQASSSNKDQETKSTPPMPPPILGQSGNPGRASSIDISQYAPIVAPQPHYPEQEQRLGHEGKVQLKIRVNSAGRVIKVILLHSSGYPRLDQEAEGIILQQWRFPPRDIRAKAQQLENIQKGKYDQQEEGCWEVTEVLNFELDT